MKTAMMLFSAGLALAADKPHQPARIDDPRTVVVGANSKAIDVYVAPLQDTLIVLPENEHIKDTFIGNGPDWLLEKPKTELTRFLSVKVQTNDPIQPYTNLNIVSDHDKPYTFRLIFSLDHADSKVFIEGDSALKADLEKPVQWVLASVAGADTERYKKEAEDAREQVKKTAADVDAKAEEYRAKYPYSLRFDYEFDRARGERLVGLQEIWHDSRSTFFRINTQIAPTLYEIRNGKEEPVGFDLRDGVFVVDRILQQGYLVPPGTAKHTEVGFVLTGKGK